MTVTSINTTSGANAGTSNKKTSLSELDQGDFIKLMLAQMQQQDPFNPTDQTEMLAQMAQFSSLAGTTEMADTLSTISSQMDALASAQEASNDVLSALLNAVTSANSKQTQPDSAAG